MNVVYLELKEFKTVGDAIKQGEFKELNFTMKNSKKFRNKKEEKKNEIY